MKAGPKREVTAPPLDLAVAAVMAFAAASTSKPGPQMWVFDE
jgi:hypothetical protein